MIPGSIVAAVETLRDIDFVNLGRIEKPVCIFLIDTGFQEQLKQVRVDMRILFHE